MKAIKSLVLTASLMILGTTYAYATPHDAGAKHPSYPAYGRHDVQRPDRNSNYSRQMRRENTRNIYNQNDWQNTSPRGSGDTTHHYGKRMSSHEKQQLRHQIEDAQRSIYH